MTNERWSDQSHPEALGRTSETGLCSEEADWQRRTDFPCVFMRFFSWVLPKSCDWMCACRQHRDAESIINDKSDDEWLEEDGEWNTKAGEAELKGEKVNTVAIFCPLYLKVVKASTSANILIIGENSNTCTRQMHDASALVSSPRKPQVNPAVNLNM